MRTSVSRHAVALSIFVPVLLAAPGARAEDAPPLKPEELEQIVAPIALYPDPLLAQVLMASTYPLEIVEAARWQKSNPKVTGDKLNEALKGQDWDDSVKSLVSFPDVLKQMNEQLDWTQKLGDAFLAQQKDVMDAVQRLRAKANAEGNLKSNDKQTVEVQPASSGSTTQTIVIQPANPQVVYVPSYNPTVVYGSWPYPAYPPYGYGWATAAAVTGSFISFGMGMAAGAALWGGCNWGRGDVDVDVNRYNNFNRNTSVNRSNVQNKFQGGQWQHDPGHRKGVGYRDSGTQEKFNRGGRPGVDSREAFRGRAEQGRRDIARGDVPKDFGGRGGDRPGRGGEGVNRGGDRPGRGGDRAAVDRGGRGGGGERPGGGNRGGVERGSRGGGSGAFGGAGGGGRQARADSARGHSSLASSRGGGGGSSVSRGGGGGGSRSGGGTSRGGGGGGRSGGGGGGRRR